MPLSTRSCAPHPSLLEGFLRRLARHPKADAYVLRGGLRLRAWWPHRVARDVDLVCAGSTDVREDVQRILRTQVPDGIRFDAERIGLVPVRDAAGLRGFRVVAAGWVDGVGGDLPIDIALGLPLGPGPIRARLASGRGAATVWMCRPETQVARKLRVLVEPGPERWRPKDLVDLHALTDLSWNRDALAEALFAAFHEAPHEHARAQEALARPQWWVNRGSRAAWRRHLGPRAPRLAEVVVKVRDRFVERSGGWA
ncbi:MAG: nucleotidyl transferase AbiEii/AbiGii toxin family protein [Myxococcota bacterium]